LGAATSATFRFAHLGADDDARLHRPARQAEHVPDQEVGIDLGVGDTGGGERRHRLVSDVAKRSRSGAGGRRIHAMECNALASMRAEA
jgi:hypothetical protein